MNAIPLLLDFTKKTEECLVDLYFGEEPGEIQLLRLIPFEKTFYLCHMHLPLLTAYSPKAK